MFSLLTFGSLIFGYVSAQYWGRFDCPWRRVYFPYSGYSPPYPSPVATLNPYSNPLGTRMCMDTRAECPFWASTGQCAANPLLMQRTCGRSCGTCALPPSPSTFGGVPPRSIYETGTVSYNCVEKGPGILRKTNIHPLSETKKSRLLAETSKRI